jgi:hypothetical protein
MVTNNKGAYQPFFFGVTPCHEDCPWIFRRRNTVKIYGYKQKMNSKGLATYIVNPTFPATKEPAAYSLDRGLISGEHYRIFKNINTISQINTLFTLELT